MSLDERLRQGLEGLDALEGMPPDSVVEAVLGRGRRSRWTRRLVAGAVALMLAITGLVVAPKALDALRSAGDQRPATPKGDAGLITTVAGTGEQGDTGDGGAATEAPLNFPVDLDFDGEGNLYILELGYGESGRVRRVDRSSGTITTVLGQGAPGDAGRANLGVTFGATGLAVDPQANAYVTGGDGTSTAHRVIRVDPAGNITTFAGTGEQGHAGDGGQATEATLGYPYDVAIDPLGNLYISDGNRIRKIDTSGIITTIAGTGRPGFTGDGGPAVAAQLDAPRGIAVDTVGNVYFIDIGNARIRRIDSEGVITTVAGSGAGTLADRGTDRCFSGDGGAATQAHLCLPEHIWVDPAGNVYIADTYNARVRMVDTDGIITTVAGNGEQGPPEDGVRATETRLAHISGVAIGPDGALYIADSAHDRVRRVAL
jgi:trimeric autotransporter adhesin